MKKNIINTYQNSKCSQDKIIIRNITIAFLWFLPFCTIFSWAGCVAERLHIHLLNKYYCHETIVKDNLRIVSTRNEIIVSNGDILPHHEHYRFVKEMWIQTIPCIVIWIIIFIFLFFYHSILSTINNCLRIKLQSTKKQYKKKTK
jgi:hypothetical protein